MEHFIAACRRQYRQAFTQLRQAVELCPDELWIEREGREPPIWQQVFHTLLVTQGYATASFEGAGEGLAADVLELREAEQGEPPWRPLVEAVGRLMDGDERPPGKVGREPMSELLETVHRQCNEALERDADLPPEAPEANPFPWTGSTSIDKHIYNVRHLQHHIGRVNGVLRCRANIGNPWVAEDVAPKD